MVNVDLLRRELEFLTAHPQLHDQGTWVTTNTCDTTACLAGWTVLHANVPLGSTDFTLMNDQDEFVYTANGRSIDKVARELLDLTAIEATALFYEALDVVDLWLIARVVTRGAIQPPAHLRNEVNARAAEWDEDGGLGFLDEDDLVAS